MASSNDKQRLEWVKYWAEYMRKNPNKVWSNQQAKFINSVMRTADTSPEAYLKIKRLVGKR